MLGADYSHRAAINLPYVADEIYTSRSRRRLYRSPKRVGQALILLLGIVLVFYYVPGFFRTEDNKSVRVNSPTRQHNESLAEKLAREVRVLCWVMTTPKNHKTKAVHVLRTWGKRCNRILFVTSEPDDELDTILAPVEDKYDNLWGKTHEAFRYIYEHHRDEAEWFMKADDDTYVFVENLRLMLYPYSPEMPIFFGCNFKLDQNLKNSYMSGGSGYVLSKEALRRFAEVGLKDGDKCRLDRDDNAEDMEMGKCLYAIDVLAGDSRDSQRKMRFCPFEPFTVLMSKYFEKDFWWYDYSYYHVRSCQDCLSEYAITFHYVDAQSMYLYEYFKYDFEVIGVTHAVETLPGKLKPEEVVIPETDNERWSEG